VLAVVLLLAGGALALAPRTRRDSAAAPARTSTLIGS
jgi:hypothetical protein